MGYELTHGKCQKRRSAQPEILPTIRNSDSIMQIPCHRCHKESTEPFWTLWQRGSLHHLEITISSRDLVTRCPRIALQLPARRLRQNVNLFLREPLVMLICAVCSGITSPIIMRTESTILLRKMRPRNALFHISATNPLAWFRARLSVVYITDTSGSRPPEEGSY